MQWAVAIQPSVSLKNNFKNKTRREKNSNYNNNQNSSLAKFQMFETGYAWFLAMPVKSGLLTEHLMAAIQRTRFRKNNFQERRRTNIFELKIRNPANSPWKTKMNESNFPEIFQNLEVSLSTEQHIKPIASQIRKGTQNKFKVQDVSNIVLPGKPLFLGNVFSSQLKERAKRPKFSTQSS